MIKLIRNLFRKSWLFFANLSMQKKLVVIFVFLITLPITYVSYSSYRTNSNSVLASTTASAGQMTDNAMDKVDRYIADLKRYTILPLYNKDVQKYLDQKGTDWDKNSSVNMFLMYLANTKEEISAVYMIDHYNSIFYYNKPGVNELYPYERLAEWRVRTEQASTATVLTGMHPIRVNVSEQRQVFTVMRSIQSVSTLKNIGMIVIDVDISLFEGIIQPLNTVTHGDTLIVDDLGKVVYNSDPAELGKDLSGSPLLAQATASRGNFRLDIDGEPYMAVYTVSESTGWKTLVYIPLKELLAPMKQSRNAMMIMTLSILSFALLVAMFISYALTKPMKRTVQLMKQVQRGKLDVRVNVKYNDEIGMLGSHFNRMIGRVRDLLQEVYETEQSKQKADMLALQNQINPHFIYNTLESIRMLAELNDDDRVAELTYLLGLLLRYSITRSDEIVTVKQELQHVENYLQLLQLRFPEKISYCFLIPETYHSLPIIKLVFQPIVENAIFHGLEKQAEPGTITITAWSERDDVIFTIHDDGVGMDEERLASLNQSLKDGKTDKFGIGLRNVNERVRLHYGENSGLVVSSRLGEGTIVTLRISGFLRTGEMPLPEPNSYA
ncbi:sensor histidine kinase [Paenibacillus vini]|uniref:cache domain-containing sensor histidine kinase n=1 Tax=Paenibacillus vini TaxID=1476024 RepID=UPI0025B712F8|nr:sensor histidine kinase [Paenibacillus vini]MDN4068928.1 sensor histidine kinase [Paenibacillus vini]